MQTELCVNPASILAIEDDLLPESMQRAHRTHTEEFYEVTESTFDLPELRAELIEWERIYNTVRPHKALNYLTPLEFLERWKENKREEVLCH
jgi:transposase InsO family protein